MSSAFDCGQYETFKRFALKKSTVPEYLFVLPDKIEKIEDFPAPLAPVKLIKIIIFLRKSEIRDFFFLSNDITLVLRKKIHRIFLFFS